MSGFSLIEVVIFIVVVSVALVIVLKAFETAGQGSADPVVRRQSLAIAQSLLDEINFKNFSPGGYASNCSSHAASTCNVAARSQFDDVSDYNGFSMTGISDLSGTAVTGLSGYTASVSVTAQALGTLSASNAYHIVVSVTDPSGQTLALDGYRTNY